jgi:hypothetical protein
MVLTSKDMVGAMNIHINSKLTLSITSISLLLAANMPSAYAQQRGGARFNFAPQIYPLEQTRVPDSYFQPGAPHAVRSGHVPSSKDILGIDPGSLPVAPVPAPAPASIAQRQPNLMQATPAHYQESFGVPNNVPALAALPKTLAPLSLPRAAEKPYSANKAVSAKLMHAKNNRYMSANVKGKLLKKNHAAGQSGQALALKPASYANNFGYEPGPTVPVASGDGMTVKADVSGKLLTRNFHKNGR